MTVVLGHSVEEFLTLRPQEVAMLILADLQSAAASSRTKVNAWNYNRQMQVAASAAGAAPDDAMMAGAVALEGWQWLRANGFLAPNHHQDGWERLTRSALSTNPSVLIAESRALGVLREIELDDELRRTVEPLMTRGKYDDAVLAGMRLVEDRVRFAGKYSNRDIGVPLMRKAFGPTGPLRDQKLDPGEANGRMELFVGAVGVFKESREPSDCRE